MQQREYVGYWLFYAQRCAEHAFSEALRACCVEQNKSYVITPPQWNVLATLTAEDGLTTGTLSQRCGLDAPTISGIVTRLHRHGLVQRVHDEQDRRVVNVYLTAEAHDLMIPLRIAVEAFSTMLLQGFSEAEQQEMLRKLQQMITNVSGVAPGTGDRFNWLPMHIHL